MWAAHTHANATVIVAVIAPIIIRSSFKGVCLVGTFRKQFIKTKGHQVGVIMENYIIVGIIAAIAVIGVIYTVRHFKGEGGCCGTGSFKPKRKKLSKVLYKKIFRVEGMHCEHCKNRVEEVVNDIGGVAAKVDLRKNELTVSYAENVDDEIIISRIERAGYTVIK